LSSIIKEDEKKSVMSKTGATLIGVVLIVIVLHAFRAMKQSNIIGKVVTKDNAVWVYVVSGNDSLKAMVKDGQFKFTVKPGSWKVLIGHSKLLIDEGLVEVQEGSTLDLGTIRLN
jgi:hypothetical protein